MGKGRRGSGVEVRDKSIRVSFTWKGVRCRETLDVPPTPPNKAYAARLVADINRAIGNATFRYADFFPDSPRAKTGENATATLEERGKLWLASKGRLAPATKDQYKNALNFWYETLGKDKSVADIPHGKLAAIVGEQDWPSAGMCNNTLIPLRGLFSLALRDDLIKSDPMDGIENAKKQRQPPDPFDLDEVEVILADMEKHYDPRVWSYYEYAFFTGLRPEEEIAQWWPDIDWRMTQARVERAKTFRGDVRGIKTYQVRDVDLNSRALAALERMKPYTFLKSDYVFENPVTGQPWHDERSQRDHYWKPTLKRTGIRARRQYQTRHTFATIALMGGVNPTYISRQLGHKNAKMLFDVYAKWIDMADKGRERAKVEAAVRTPLPAMRRAAND